ncbi:BC1881 family protein [Phaeobacter gallaeciensis]|uniref:BC1881 family protein n=1 Tax=Phaeobacter gallaeciensis TaxID=60890 RepID=UPI00238029A6|nr:BC1881 family protein [Phaeobacter gallaeciensis]MDE4274767.1 BC1881 family protein [Phaeobacter gallaeciensis]MDE4299659.1 BC1881 family protein [Phaeobacter gallaeciensis]MDE5184824.1 BC1881 family protein [Phaeobacter gallaeciensis]
MSQVESIPHRADLSEIPTCDLHDELIKREAVTATFLGPEDELKKVVRGPAWVIVNRD